MPMLTVGSAHAFMTTCIRPVPHPLMEPDCRRWDAAWAPHTRELALNGLLCPSACSSSIPASSWPGAGILISIFPWPFSRALWDALAMSEMLIQTLLSNCRSHNGA